MKILSTNSTFFAALPSQFKYIYPAVELADINDTNVTYGAKTIFVSENKEAHELIQLVHQKKYTHIVQYNEDYFLNDLELAALIIDKPELYFSGQAQILIKEPVKTLVLEFSKASEKENLFLQIHNFFAEVSPQNVQESALAILEELFMNAIYDAPKEAKLSGKSHFPYENGAQAKMILSLSEERLAISCSDPYGSLQMRTFISRLCEVYDKGAGAAMQMKSGAGAGIGCMIMFENCDNLFLGVIPGRQTVVSCLIPVGLNYRRRANMKKSLHLITV